MIDLPDPDSEEFTMTPGVNSLRKERSKEAALKFWQAECNRKWRGLVLAIKAKLITVTEGIRTLDQEFLYDFVLPNNQTVGEYLAPQLEKSLAEGKMPPLLPGVSE